MRYVIPITPTPAPRMTRSDKWRNPPRKPVANYFLFRDLLQIKFRELGIDNLPPVFGLEFYLPMPESWSNKKKLSMKGKPHQQRPDIDNLLKAFQDSLASEDGFIYHVEISKFWGEKEGYMVLTINE